MNNYSIMSDGEILTEEVRQNEVNNSYFISPFLPTKTGNPSHGLSSHGYDITLGNTFLQYASKEYLIPGEQRLSCYKTIVASYSLELEPGGFILGHSLETFNIPDNITGLVCDKSTYARLGIALQNTVLESGWSGEITLEITNHNSVPVSLLVGKGIAQVLFFRSNGCLRPYKGKYQNQTGVTLAK